jgi:hypothetical protein
MLQIFAPAEGMISGFSKKAKLNCRRMFKF